MNRTTHYPEEISQTALALLALVAAGKSLDTATVQSLRSLLISQNDSRENRVHLTIFSDLDGDYGNAETPVIIPFAERSQNVRRCHNGYGALSLKNRASNGSNADSYLRVFSPDDTDDADEESSCCLATTNASLKIYAE